MANRLFVEPLLSGSYPSDTLDDLGVATWFDGQPAEDRQTIAAPIDFLGINYYFRYRVAAGNEFATPVPELPTTVPIQLVDQGVPRTHMNWPVTPNGIVDAMRMIHARRPELPIVITENGAAYDDLVIDGRIHDEPRRAYIEAHLEACRRAVAEGLLLRGYFIWTLMDNFEWAWGQSRRFGLIRVDYDNQRRTIKDSGRWLSQFLRGTDADTGRHPAS